MFGIAVVILAAAQGFAVNRDVVGVDSIIRSGA